MRASLKEALAQRSQKVLTRTRQVRTSAVSPHIVVDGKSYLNFASSDYLGLANDPRVVHAFKRGVDQYGAGSGAACVVSGYTAAHQSLEEALADFLGYPRVLLFSTGYMANVGVLTALSSHLDCILQDKQCHASLVDGAKFANIEFVRYLHGSAENLAKRLEKQQAKRCLVVTDGVFSVRGDIAPLTDMVQKIRQTPSAYLMVDDAHGIGVLGQKGGGSLEHFGLPPSAVDILVGTFGKAFGTFGAFVAGDETLIEALMQYARSYVYTTALPPAVAEATHESLRLIQSEPWRREKLKANIADFQQRAVDLDLTYDASFTPIQSILIGSSESAMMVGQMLAEQGIYVAVMRPPTTLPHKSCLRVTLTALHQTTHIEQLFSALSSIPH
jgi:8-amino-7-oxononanoate synthase